MSARESGSFESPEAAVFWRYISSTLDRLVDLAGGCAPEVAAWAPPAPGANSVLALANHTLANAEENLLGLVLGERVARDREAEFDPGAGPDGLRVRWQALRPALEAGLRTLRDDRMGAPLSHPRRGEITVREVLLVLARHAAEHLGQVELTRDLAHAHRPSLPGR
ncbi:MAG: DinB family protein [Dehalococcoidia bacterium]